MAQQRRGKIRSWTRIMVGLGGWLVLQSASCGEIDERLCRAANVTGQWEQAGGGSLRISGGTNDVTVRWERSGKLDGEDRALNYLIWPDDKSNVLKEITLGDGDPIQDPADNIGTSSGTTSLYVGGPQMECWPQPGETRCQAQYRLRLKGLNGQTALRGEVELWRTGWFLWNSVGSAVETFSIEFTRNQPLVNGVCPTTGNEDSADAGSSQSGGGGGCGGGSYDSSDGDGGRRRRDAGEEEEEWNGSSSGSPWWEESSVSSSSTSMSSSSSGGGEDSAGTSSGGGTADADAGVVGESSVSGSSSTVSSSSSGGGESGGTSSGGSSSSAGQSGGDGGTDDASESGQSGTSGGSGGTGSSGASSGSTGTSGAASLSSTSSGGPLDAGVADAGE